MDGRSTQPTWFIHWSPVHGTTIRASHFHQSGDETRCLSFQPLSLSLPISCLWMLHCSRRPTHWEEGWEWSRHTPTHTRRPCPASLWRELRYSYGDRRPDGNGPILISSPSLSGDEVSFFSCCGIIAADGESENRIVRRSFS